MMGQLHSTPFHGSTQLHATPIAYKQIHGYRALVMCHVMEPSRVTGQLHSTPLSRSTPLHSTPLHSTRVRADPRTKKASHMTCYGVVTHDGYTPLHSTPYAYIPVAPRIQGRDHVTSPSPVTCDDVPEPNTCYLQVPLVPTWSDLIRSLTGLGRCPQIIPFSPVWLL
jgi:hypothetical protein